MHAPIYKEQIVFVSPEHVRLKYLYGIHVFKYMHDCVFRYLGKDWLHVWHVDFTLFFSILFVLGSQHEHIFCLWNNYRLYVSLESIMPEQTLSGSQSLSPVWSTVTKM